MDAAIRGLEARLARNGGSDADWNLLAQAYQFQGRADDARRARAHQATVSAGSVSEMSMESIVAAANSAAGGSAATAGAATAGAVAPPATAAELQARLNANPRDTGAWLALADVQRAQHQDGAARASYEKVIALQGMSAQAWADYADVLASMNGGSLGGPAGHAIDMALAADAANAKALWLKASQAHEQHHYSDALAWWRKLLATLPADSPDARIINNNIAEDTQLAGSAPVAADAGRASEVQVVGTVTVDDKFAARVQQGATLFIYAKAADSSGPPLAILRTTAGAWPVSFRLDDSMAMLPSRRLSQFDKVVIEARISRSGQASPSSGDLYVVSPVLRPREGKKLALVINQEIG